MASDPVLTAAQTGDLDKLKRLDEALVISAADANGSTAWHWAAGRGHLAVCRWLHSLSSPCPRRTVGGRFVERTGAGRTALHYAARNGHLRTVQWLVVEA